jgi:hypothetical protein
MNKKLRALGRLSQYGTVPTEVRSRDLLPVSYTGGLALSNTNPLGSLLRAYPNHPCHPYPEDPYLCTLSTPYAENHDTHYRGSSSFIDH